jgi:hypothetical protein
MRSVPVALTVAAFALSLAAPAAAQWSSPQAVSGAGDATGVVTAAYDARGDGLLVWSGVPGARYRTATLPAGAAAWQPGPPLAPRFAYLHAQPAIALYGRTRALLVGPRREGAGASLRYAMVTSLGRADGRFGTQRRLDAGTRAARSLSTPSLSVTAAGDALAAWSRGEGRASVIRVAERGAGGPLRRLRTLSPSGARVPAAATNARRDRVVAWYRGGRIEARVRSAGGAWGPVLRVTGSRHTPSVLRAAVDPRGRVVLAWSTIDLRPGAESLLAFRAAVRAPDGRWSLHLLDRYTAHGASFSGAQRQVHVAQDPAGRVTVGWQRREGDLPAFGVARLTRGDDFTAPVVAGVPARPSDLVAARDGRVAAVWWSETGTTTPAARVGVAIAAPDGRFGAAETLPVTCPSFICLPADARAAFDPAAGRLTVAWVQRDDAAYRVWASGAAAPG